MTTKMNRKKARKKERKNLEFFSGGSSNIGNTFLNTEFVV